jgi:cell division protease FtsH
MARIYGMTEVAGLMVLAKQSNQFISGGQTTKDYSDKLANDLDEYIKSTLQERYDHVLIALKEHDAAVEIMAAELLDIEVITGKRVQEIIKQTGKVVYEDGDLHDDTKAKDKE